MKLRFSHSFRFWFILPPDYLVNQIFQSSCHGFPNSFYHFSGSSVLPKIPKSICGDFRIPDSVLDISVAQVSLDPSGILAFVGQIKPGRMPKHVRVNRKEDPGFFPDFHYQVADCSICEGTLSL
jgi:hypothetical protein